MSAIISISIAIVVISPGAPISFKINYIKINLDMLLNKSKVQVNIKIKQVFLEILYLLRANVVYTPWPPKRVQLLLTTIWMLFNKKHQKIAKPYQNMPHGDAD